MTEQEFELFYLEHHNGVFRSLYRLLGNSSEAEELVQEAFVQFHLRQGEVQKKSYKPWVYQVALRLGYDALRKRQRDQRLHLEQKRQKAIFSEVADNNTEKALSVRQTLALLPEKQVLLLGLHTAGLTHREIALSLRVSEQSISQMLWRARQAFRSTYEKTTHRKRT